MFARSAFTVWLCIPLAVSCVTEPREDSSDDDDSSETDTEGSDGETDTDTESDTSQSEPYETNWHCTLIGPLGTELDCVPASSCCGHPDPSPPSNWGYTTMGGSCSMLWTIDNTDYQTICPEGMYPGFECGCVETVYP